MLAHTVTVLVTDEAGKPIRAGLRGWQGLQPLSDVVVSGRVASKTKDGAMVIHARRIHVTTSDE